jgi:SPP1 family predicted phage head-tail adaptor
MNYKDVINLYIESKIKNEANGNIETSLTLCKKIYANKKSIRQSEFYQARASGLQAEIMFEVFLHDYSDEKVVEYNTKKYNVVRTFQKAEDKLELICMSIEVTT